MRILKAGSTGAQVELLQLALTRAGFGPLSTDGFFGAETESALRRFQQSRGLVPDGAAGQQTHRALLPFYTGFVMHRVRPGESLYSLSRRYGSSAAAIERANPGTDPAALAVGTELVVPLPFPVTPTAISWCSELVGYVLRGLAARYPFISVGEIGRSVMGRPLRRFSMGTGRNRVLYTASHHANEWICTPLLFRFAEELAEAYVSGGFIYGQSAAEIMDYASIHFVPALDVDGMDLVTGALSPGDYCRRALDISAAYPQFPFPSGWKANIQGIDLNLQYPAGWEQARANKYALGIISPAPAEYVGPAPLSASESRAMYDFTLALAPELVLTYHTQGEVIYWRYRDIEVPGASEIAAAFSQVSGYAAEETPFSSGFAGYKDWFIDAFRRPGFTIEAGLGENPLPLEQFEDIYRANLGILTLGALVT